ncbi:hypothetical protein [Limnochorda pilosa]|uniref:Uncharacterized protein n=1 Tax=Limnochorda pilosa TaxID=1555112 RepID=A0A0K2SHD4_LIMPI|nr:hypothetical protein [Limnochorda pilosa]BAS26447.1 hypothetical protein LIP_0590 [Limnochorda pilosa]
MCQALRAALARCMGWFASDRVVLGLPGLRIEVRRHTRSQVPAELTVVVPRAEFRRRRGAPGCPPEMEIIYSGITVAHSPRHAPEAGGRHPVDLATGATER